VLRGQAWLHGWFSGESRAVLGLVIVILTVVVAIVISSSRLFRVVFDALDVVAVLGLFLVNWLGNGGALVPIPGARFVGLLLVFQQAVILPSWEVFGIAGAAMSLGLLSYYVAGARTAQSYAEGDTEAAERLAADTGMLGEDSGDFAPGAELDEPFVRAVTGEPADEAGPEPAPRTTPTPAGAGRLRQRFSSSLQRAQDRARPVLERRGMWGMFLLCFAPTPMGTAAAYLGGLMRFGFRRYLLASFAAKYLLAGVLVVLALVFNDAARAVALPEFDLPEFDLPEFDLRLFDLPVVGPEAPPSPSPASSLEPGLSPDLPD
jgi:hypothetical protein